MPILLTPGPVPIPPFVQEAIAKPVIHHRTSDFESLYGDILENLRYIFQTQHHTALAIGSGTYGLEMAMYSLFKPQEKILVVDMGKFSGRWATYGKLLGLEVISHVNEWGNSPTVEELMDLLYQHPDCKGMVLTHSETSTGAMIDLEEIAFSVKQHKPEVLLLVDAITSIGAMPFYFDTWQIDLAVVASQKALLNPAGTIAFAASPLAMERMGTGQGDDFRHLGNYLMQAAQSRFPFTAPVQLFYGLQAGLHYMQQQTLPVLWQSVHQSALTFRAGLTSLGGQLLAEPCPSTSLTAFHFEDQPALPIRLALEEAGYTLAGGQGHWKEHLLRISHMGMADAPTMELVLSALEDILTNM